jgi:hypothetical protein
VLATETATDHHNACRKVCEADAALRYVLVLAALASGAKHIDAALREQRGGGRRNRNPGMGSVFRHQAPLVVRALLLSISEPVETSAGRGKVAAIRWSS